MNFSNLLLAHRLRNKQIFILFLSFLRSSLCHFLINRRHILRRHEKGDSLIHCIVLSKEQLIILNLTLTESSFLGFQIETDRWRNKLFKRFLLNFQIERVEIVELKSPETRLCKIGSPEHLIAYASLLRVWQRYSHLNWELIILEIQISQQLLIGQSDLLHLQLQVSKVRDLQWLPIILLLCPFLFLLIRLKVIEVLVFLLHLLLSAKLGHMLVFLWSHKRPMQGSPSLLRVGLQRLIHHRFKPIGSLKQLV